MLYPQWPAIHILLELISCRLRVSFIATSLIVGEIIKIRAYGI